MKRCGCCGREAIAQFVGGPAVFSCHCTDELLCRTCNHCEKHCKCDADLRDLDVPLTEQLLVAKQEWAQMGVRV